ncbi:MAG: ORF6N domain-containing protein [Elusimicrobia bacterium]|nr:ORF6N domain-containing protein [Elusimicrobiota bacterium]
MNPEKLIPQTLIESRILVVRGCKVIIDSDLANLYGASTKRLNEQVKRNKERFPDDFMFQLTSDEKAEVVANCDHLRKLKFSPSLPYVFTEYGSIMAANVLNSQQAIHVSIAVVRTFARLREMIAAHKELAHRLAELEKKCDVRFSAAFTAIRRLLPDSTRKHKKQIGFTAK